MAEKSAIRAWRGITMTLPKDIPEPPVPDLYELFEKMLDRARAEGRLEGMREQLEAADEASSEIWAQIYDFHQGCKEQGCEVLRMDNAMRRAMKRRIAAADRELDEGEKR